MDKLRKLVSREILEQLFIHNDIHLNLRNYAILYYEESGVYDVANITWNFIQLPKYTGFCHADYCDDICRFCGGSCIRNSRCCIRYHRIMGHFLDEKYEKNCRMYSEEDPPICDICFHHYDIGNADTCTLLGRPDFQIECCNRQNDE